MGRAVFSVSDYNRARQTYGVTSNYGVTHQAEERARRTGQLDPLVDPAVDPMRRSKIRLDPQDGQWRVTVGCPMDIELSCDTTGSMGGEVDTEMAVLPDLYASVSKVLPGYDPQLCLGIFGDYTDPFVLCRPQFEMEAAKIVRYLQAMAPQRRGGGNNGEDPQYAMFARAYLTDAYTNRIGLKGYHFIVTDEPCHMSVSRSMLKRIFGQNVFDEELRCLGDETPSVEAVVAKLKQQTHQFALVLSARGYYDTVNSWRELCGIESVIEINSTRDLPTIVSAIIGLTEGTLDLGTIQDYCAGCSNANYLAQQLSAIDIGAQSRLRQALPHSLPQKGDIFARKNDLWPILAGKQPVSSSSPATESKDDQIIYL